VTIPLLLPAITSSALIVFTLSIDDYLITSFVAGVSSTTLPLQIYSMLRTSVTPEVNAISTIMLITTTIAIFLSQRLLKEK
jgi:spermidine/putrescine transport system permease protein